MPVTKRRPTSSRQPASSSKPRAASRSKAKTTSSSSSSRRSAGTKNRRSRASSSRGGDDDDGRRTRSRSSSRARESSGRRRSRSPPPSAPKAKRPMTAYMAFIQAKTKNVSMSRTDCSARIRELAAQWRAMSAQQKEEFQAMADRANSSGGRAAAARRGTPSRQAQ